MRVLPALAALALLACLLAPAAAAYPQPAFYFLKSPRCPVPETAGECLVPESPALPPSPVPVPVPVGVPYMVDGILDAYDPMLYNYPNSTEPDVRAIYPGSEAVVPIRFTTGANESHPDRIKGPFLIGLWIGGSPAPHANLTVTLYEVPVEGAPIALANATKAIDTNTSKAPEPGQLVPPNSTDPQAIAIHAVGQVLPMIYQPPNLFVLPAVDITFGNDSSFAVGFRLDPGSSPAPSAAGVAQIQYNATYQPSFVYVPWYAPDPPRSSFTRTSTYTRTFGTGTRGAGGGGGGDGGGDDGDGDGKGKNGIPGLEMTFVVTLVVVAAWAARRRL